jgi:zinc transport system substrate-binding protein
MRSRTVISRTLTAAGAALLTLGTASACGNDAAGAPGSDRLAVVTAFYPLQYISERIGGDAVTVSNLTKPGAEPHDLELNPQQVGDINDAGLVVYLKGFQPAVDEAVEQQAKDRAFDASTVEPLLAADAGAHEHAEGGADEPTGEPTGEPHAEESGSGTDPHVWLDPTRLATIGDKLAERLGAADNARAADYTARAKALRTDLETLDAEFSKKLTTCERREIVTSHTAFNYLAVRYKLEQVGITGLSPEDEPSPQRLAEVTREAKEHAATTIFFETLVSPKIAETIAQEVGAKTAVLDPLEGLGNAGGDYLSVMRSNLATLVTGLGCTS